MSKDCLFCKIIRGELPSTKIYEDENVVTFLDIFPFSRGHTVVVPVQHCENFFDFPEDKMEKYFSILQKQAFQIKTNLNADGINIIQNNYSAAGQVVFHMHYHIIPRWKNDKKLELNNPKEQASPEYLAEVLTQIKG